MKKVSFSIYNLAYLCKSGYRSEATYLRAIDTFNISESIFNVETIANSAKIYLENRDYDCIPKEIIVKSDSIPIN